MLEDSILPFFIEIAYQPYLVYLALTVAMFASSFGLPIPEEVTLISTGLVAYMGMNNPPPYPGAEPVNVYVAAIVAFLAVFLSDLVIYFLGRFFGRKILKMRFMKRYEPRMNQIAAWTQKYGQWAAGVFRFTPGIRFPGHFSCGMMGLPLWKFIMVDGSAALLSVPIQIVLVANYGKEIIASIKEFQTIILAILAVIGILYFLNIYRKKRALAKIEIKDKLRSEANPT